MASNFDFLSPVWKPLCLQVFLSVATVLKDVVSKMVSFRTNTRSQNRRSAATRFEPNVMLSKATAR